MKLKSRLTLSMALLAGCSFAHADITNNPASTFYSLNSASLNTTSWSWAPDRGGGTLSMSALQYGRGATAGTLDASDAVDPTLTRGNDVINDTGFAWGGYKVVITMPQTFTISSVGVDIPSGGGWTDTVIPATLSGGSYVGEIDFTLPTINNGDELSLSYKVAFSGSLHYTINEDFTPLPVPEPGIAGLALLGGLVLGGVRLARRSLRS